MTKTVIVGAGIAGLACARELTRLGAGRVVLLEKSRGVGGRCATRRVEGQPVDHGVCFFHGRDPDFLDDLDGVDSDRIDGWPARVAGEGPPCQPRAFADDERRLTFAEGVTAFPKHLAKDLDVRRETAVVSVAHGGKRLTLGLADGSTTDANEVVLALPAPQSRALLEPLARESSELRPLAYLLRGTGSQRCLTALAGYGAKAPLPEWDIWYPDDSRVLQLISHDSSKRRGRPGRILLLQALPDWSRKHWDTDEATWIRSMLEEGARIAGAWVSHTSWTQSHRWRYGRARGSGEFSGPLLVPLAGGTRIGVTGEVFAPGGGVQAAWISGRELARRLMETSDEQ